MNFMKSFLFSLFLFVIELFSWYVLNYCYANFIYFFLQSAETVPFTSNKEINIKFLSFETDPLGTVLEVGCGDGAEDLAGGERSRRGRPGSWGVEMRVKT